MPNLELTIELLEIQNITLEEGIWYEGNVDRVEFCISLKSYIKT